jgi:hypothetical protein
MQSRATSVADYLDPGCGARRRNPPKLENVAPDVVGEAIRRIPAQKKAKKRGA